MDCNHEMLQAFLDKELETIEISAINNHLAQCRSCRQELSRLKLLWLDLANAEEIIPHPSLPFIRQQVMAQVRSSLNNRQETSFDFMENQKLAWHPLGFAVAYLPGVDLLQDLVKDTSKKLPGLIFNSLTKNKKSWGIGLINKIGRGNK